jgi:sorbitol/mannitol transport system permease protein
MFRRKRAEVAAIERAPGWLAVVAWTVGLLVFFPILNLFLTGFKSETDALALPPALIPVPAGVNLPFAFTPTLENYAAVFDRGFPPFLLNSVAAVLISTLVVLALGVPCAYALAFRPGPRKKTVLTFFISTKYLPAVGVVVPVFIIMKNLDALDSLPAIIIMYTAMNVPIAVWMLRSFLEEVPKEILEAARVDGVSVWQEIKDILLPMMTPGLVATVFICIIFSWNEFFFAVSLLAHDAATVPMFMIGFVTSEGLFWAKLAAAGTMAMMPVVIIGWAAQRQLVRGLSMGAVK